MEPFDVAVIGAGAMGSATALSLARRNARVVLLDRFAEGHARGASHGAVRIFRLSYPDVDYVRLARRAMPAWRRLEEEAGERLLVTTGGLDAGPVAPDCARALGEAGVRHDWLTRGEASARFPMFDFEGLDRVLFQPEGGVALADRTVAAQTRLARERGVDVRTNTTLLSISPSPSGGVVLETDGGELQARVVVATPGPWAGGLLSRLVGRDMRIRQIGRAHV